MPPALPSTQRWLGPRLVQDTRLGSSGLKISRIALGASLTVYPRRYPSRDG
jgi:hypothetical protein